jgi:hypothetical protein
MQAGLQRTPPNNLGAPADAEHLQALAVRAERGHSGVGEALALLSNSRVRGYPELKSFSFWKGVRMKCAIVSAMN